jgi:hypothetical protein
MGKMTTKEKIDFCKVKIMAAIEELEESLPEFRIEVDVTTVLSSTRLNGGEKVFAHEHRATIKAWVENDI